MNFYLVTTELKNGLFKSFITSKTPQTAEHLHLAKLKEKFPLLPNFTRKTIVTELNVESVLHSDFYSK